LTETELAPNRIKLESSLKEVRVLDARPKK